MAILSIQSHVAYGHVGNRAAVFPLERLGFEVWPINTVQFSNHTGYESWTGEVFTYAHLALVWSGVKARGRIGECEAVLSGYIGAAEVGHFILQAADEVKSANPRALYCCDPTMGDFKKGLFVAEGVRDFFKGQAMGWADIVTPNHYEAELLAGSAIASVDDAKAACEAIHAMGPSIVLITGFKPEKLRDSSISMFMSSPEGFHILSTPELHVDSPLNGAGDLAAALFLARYLQDRNPVHALELMADSIYSVLERSVADGGTELSLVASQDAFVNPKRRFQAKHA